MRNEKKTAVPYSPTDYLYLSARLRAKEASLVGKEHLARYRAMHTASEITAALVAEGIFPADTPREEALCAMLREGFETVRNGAPNPELFAFLQYPYDAHNAKTALKCHYLGKNPDGLLIDAGTVPTAAFATVPVEVPEALPAHLREALPKAREVYEQTRDPREIDFILDAACFADMTDAAAALPTAARLVQARAEMTNLRTCRRILSMQADEAGEVMLSRAFLPGGVTEKERLLCAYREGESGFAALVASGAYARVFEHEDPADVDLAMDNLYLELAKEGARAPFGAEIAIGYLVGIEYAVKNLRILLVAKETGADDATVGRRMRENYV